MKDHMNQSYRFKESTVPRKSQQSGKMVTLVPSGMVMLHTNT